MACCNLLWWCIVVISHRELGNRGPQIPAITAQFARLWTCFGPIPALNLASKSPNVLIAHITFVVFSRFRVICALSFEHLMLYKYGNLSVNIS